MSGRIICGLIADRVGAKLTLVTGLTLQAFAISLYLFTSGLTGFYIVAALFGFSYGGVMPLYAILVREYFPARIMGSVFGVAAMISTLGMAIGPYAGGWLFDHFGGDSWLYVASFGIGLGAAAVAATVYPPRLTPHSGFWFEHRLTSVVARAREGMASSRMTSEASRPPPNEASLHEAALNYLARYATTEAGLRQVLFRRIDLWARQASDREDAQERAGEAKAAVPGIIAKMVGLGLLNDTAFAENRARTLALGGRSRREIAARLAAKGINRERTEAVLPETEEVSALILCRKRRIGPFRTSAEPDRNKELGVLARAGFPRDVAVQVLAMEMDAAEAAIAEARR